MDLVQPNVSYLIQVNRVIPTEEFNARKCVVAGHDGNSKPDGQPVLEDENRRKLKILPRHLPVPLISRDSAGTFKKEESPKCQRQSQEQVSLRRSFRRNPERFIIDDSDLNNAVWRL